MMILSVSLTSCITIEKIRPVPNPHHYYVHLETQLTDTMTGALLMGGSGGGVCVERYEDRETGREGCYVLTAAHVCNVPADMLLSMSGANLSWEIFPSTIDEREHRLRSIIASDARADLCLLDVSGEFPADGEVHEIIFMEDMTLDDVLDNFGAPRGEFASGEFWQLSHYQGFWSGYSGRFFVVFNFPIRPGQSGSAITTQGGKLFSIVQRYNPRIETFGMGPRPELIYYFLKENGVELDIYGS